MPTWLGYVVYFLAIFVVIAPGHALAPVAAIVRRHVGVGGVAMGSLGVGAWTLGAAQGERERWFGVAELGLGAICAAWWLYRMAVPAYRDQAPDSAPLSD